MGGGFEKKLMRCSQVKVSTKRFGVGAGNRPSRSSGCDATPRLIALAIAGIVILGLGILLRHRQIERRIEQIGRL